MKGSIDIEGYTRIDKIDIWVDGWVKGSIDTEGYSSIDK